MRARLAAVALACTWPSWAAAQVWDWSPSITLRGTWSDNIGLQPEPLAHSGWTTELIPELQLEHVGPRLRVSAAYRYQHTFSTDEAEEESQNFLRSRVLYEVVEKSVFLEARADITQENRSAFAAPVVPGAPTSNANRAETRTLRLSPFTRGYLGDAGIWRARYNETHVETENDFGFAATRIATSELIAGARSMSAGARLGWAVEASGLQHRTDTTGTVEDKRIRGDLIFGVTPQLHALLVAGYEKTEFTRQGTESGSTPGLGLEWSPGPRTQFVGVAQRRFFGTGYLANFTHRTPHTALRLNASRDSTVLTSVLGATAGTLETMMGSLLLASIPDPMARTEAARRRLEELGSAPSTVSDGFLTERPFIYEGLDASFTIIGPRTTLVFEYNHRLQTDIGPATPALDSFAFSEQIRQRRYRASWTHRLTPLTSFTLSASGLRSVGLDEGAPSTRDDLVTFFLTSRLGPRTTGTIGIRRSDFEGTLTGHRENAVFGSLSFTI